jgi:8-oxo-dGTP diphosphatase
MQINLPDNSILSSEKNTIENFNPVVEVAMCFVEVEHKILLLKSKHKGVENKTWGAPGGKLEPLESPTEAMHRELFEETRLRVENHDMALLHTLYARLFDIDCMLHIFKLKLPGSTDKRHIKLNVREHSQYVWVAPEDALKLNLIKGEAEIIQLLYLSTS